MAGLWRRAPHEVSQPSVVVPDLETLPSVQRDYAENQGHYLFSHSHISRRERKWLRKPW